MDQDHNSDDQNVANVRRSHESEDRGLNRIIWAFVGLGLALRLGMYLLNFPLWWDEAFVAVNLLRRDFAALLLPLDYGQVCPLLFLWAELASVRLLGFSEWSLRIFPLLCSLASVLLFRFAAARILRGSALLLAVAVFSVSIHPIRHSADVKPYSADLLVALILQTLAITWWSRPDKPACLWMLVVTAPVALLLSHPAAFVVAGIGLSLVIPAWLTRRTSGRAAVLAYGLVAITTYAIVYVLFTRPQASAASPGMRQMWVNSFPPLDSIPRLVRWLFVAHTGDMLAYPCGGERGASSLNFLVAVVGSIVLWRTSRRTVLAFLLMPLVLALGAAILRLYPYGGPAPHGSSARIMQYAAPGICLLIGLGSSRLLEWIPSISVRGRIQRLVCVALVLVGSSPIIAGFVRPYRAYQAEAARSFARRFWPEVERGAEVACLRWDLVIAEWDSIHLDVAVSLCDQAIYSPSRRNGGPNWEKVSKDHPLRCVLGVGLEQDSPRLAEWLTSMQRTHLLVKRSTTRVVTSEPGRRVSEERYEVFEFIPSKATATESLPKSQPSNGS